MSEQAWLWLASMVWHMFLVAVGVLWLALVQTRDWGIEEEVPDLWGLDDERKDKVRLGNLGFDLFEKRKGRV